MDLNTTLTVALGIAIAATVGFALVIARTAKSKGYSYPLFFVLGLLSYFIMSVITVFLRPKGEPTGKAKRGSVPLLLLGIVIEFIGIGRIPGTTSASPTDSELQALVQDPSLIGGAAIAFAGVLIVIGAVANEHRTSKTEVRSL